MKCPKCKTSSSPGSNFCAKCGAVLGQNVNSGSGSGWLKIVLLMLMIGGAVYFIKGMFFPLQLRR